MVFVNNLIVFASSLIPFLSSLIVVVNSFIVVVSSFVYEGSGLSVVVSLIVVGPLVASVVLLLNC